MTGWNSSNPYPELDFIHFSPHSPRECLRELDRAKNKPNNVWELKLPAPAYRQAGKAGHSADFPVNF
jgi:hypothetical protein